MTAFHRVILPLVVLFCGAVPLLSQAQVLPDDVLKALVWVQCGTRQGSGTVINGEQGYVLTNAHVAVDTEHGFTVPDSCLIGFLDAGNQPQIFYRATVDKFSYNEARSQDFAVLKIGQHVSGAGTPLPQPFAFIKTQEFPVAGDAIRLFGYSGEKERYILRDATISGFESGFIGVSGTTIMPGDSGGAGLDVNNRLVGIPTRVVTLVPDNGGASIVTYEMIDIRAVMIWLDTYGSNAHDAYFTHADYSRYHQSAVFLQQASLDCEAIARTTVTPTVFCLLPNSTRLAFPNADTLLSWYPDFKQVFSFQPAALTPYRLARNVTFKPGTLVKVTTNPKVFVVVDTFGTLRWVPTETKAIQLWGPAWAGLVHDVPDEFFTNYTIGQPLE